MFKPDQPIKTHKEDILGRAPFARSLADAMLSYKDKDSLIIGLFGEWGSGKTSIINILLENIETRTKNKRNKPIVITFNSWIFSDQDNLILQFFKQLAVVLLSQSNSKIAVKLGEKLVKYSKFFLERNEFSDLENYFEIRERQSQNTIEKNRDNQLNKLLSDSNFLLLRRELDDLFRKLPRKVFIIIDDVDRLNNYEIKLIFQIIKVMADFPNTVFMVSMDKNVVIRALEKVQESSGVEYLEKMVQVPFVIPMLSKQEIEQSLLIRINELISSSPDNKIDRIYWGNIFHAGFKHFFRGMRDVTRYINSLKFSFEMVRQEVNLVDFFVVTALQIFTPEVFFGIRDNKNLFTGIFNPQLPSGAKEREMVKQIISRSTHVTTEILFELLKRVFPRLETMFEDITYDEEWLAVWRREGRVCSPEMFETFFALSIKESAIPRKEVEYAVSVAGDPEAFGKVLLKFNEQEKISVFLARLEDYIMTEIPDHKIPNLIATLMDMGDLFPEEDSYTEEINTPMRILHINSKLLDRFPNQAKRYEVLRNAIEKTKQSLYTVVKFLDTLDKQHNPDNKKELPYPEEMRTVDSLQLATLEELACKKIWEWAEDGRLLKHRDFAYILFCWMKWSDPAKVSEYINNVLISDSGLIDFVSAFFKKSAVSKSYDLGFSGEWRTNLQRIKKIIDLDKVEKRLRMIASYPGFKKLGKDKIAAVKGFLETIKKENI